jgi:hypothetical protein
LTALNNKLDRFFEILRRKEMSRSCSYSALQVTIVISCAAIDGLERYQLGLTNLGTGLGHRLKAIQKALLLIVEL